jgi:hypothetical protein
MAINTCLGVGDKAHDVIDIYIGVNNVARKVTKAYIGVDNIARLVYYNDFDPVFANNTWEQIIYTCQANNVPDTWKVGDSKTMTINGAAYQIDIIGKNHDTYADGSGTAQLTFQLHDLMPTLYQFDVKDTQSNEWTNCTMRKTHLPAIMALMPSEVQNGLKEVNKTTYTGGFNSTRNTADKLFLLSETEVFANKTYSPGAEGKRYEYYANNSAIKKLRGGSNNEWWLRSPEAENGIGYCYVTVDNDSAYDMPTSKNGVSFAFCF